MDADSGNTKGTVKPWLIRLGAWEIGDAAWGEAVQALVELRFDAVPQLIEALGDEQLSVHVGAGKALKQMGPAVVYDLIGALKNENPAVRRHAATLLYGSAVRDDAVVQDAVPALCEAFSYYDPDVRKCGATALEWIGSDAGQAVPDLINALRDSDWAVREWAAKALGSIGVEAKPALAALTEALLDEVPGVREAASEALDQIRSAEGQE